jgi:hypothetical protein
MEKMCVTLINSDMKQPLLDVYLRMKITSSLFSMQTPAEVRTPLITLQAGVPTILSQSDLEPYFRRENLQISGGQSQFYHTQMLPDNFYRFHFEVYEANTGHLLSNARTGFAQVLIAAGDPPVLNLPLKGSVVEESNIPSIMFTWTPRHLNSVASAYGTEYEISLAEIHDKQTSAENAFQYSRILHRERTRSTAFIYNSAHPLLQPGLRYAWRVQAIAREGLEDAQVFKNSGYSEIFWFDYKGNCPVVTSSGVVTKETEATVSWQPTQATGYTLEYRKKGGSRWYTGNVFGTSCPLYGLQRGETYEYRIGSRCYPDDLYDYSTVKAFTMPELPEKNPNCGIMPDNNITNRTPLSELTPGLPVFAGDFPVFITEVHGNGVFSGTGYVGIPFTKLPRITVTFSNITVNTDRRLIGGFFETKYDIKNKNMLWDADQTLTGGGGVGDIRTGEERAQFVVDYTINPGVKVKPVSADNNHDEIKEGETYVFTKNENGKYEFIITDLEGVEHRIESETMPVTITDGSGGEGGKTWQIDEKGNITQISSESNIKLDPSTCYRIETDIVSVEFSEIEGVTRYAVDRYKDVYRHVTEYYQQYKAGDREIAASAKFMLAGTSDRLAVRIKGDPKQGFDPSKVRFVTMSGKKYEAAYMPDDRQWDITVVAGKAGGGQELFAVYETEPGKYATIALLNIYTYEPHNIKIRLVPVNGKTNNFTSDNVRKELNAIYNKVGVSCEVEMTNSFDYEPLKTKSFNVNGSSLFSTLTDDMKAINSAYMQSGDYKSDAVTLFIIGNVSGNENITGDMPRGKQFGYLFKGSDARTIAHEIGHGVFKLEHPFDRLGRNSFTKGELSHCLMDYGEGREFCKLEWDAINAPGLVIGMFETDDASQLAIWGGITWIGDILGGLATDNQEKEIEKTQALFDHLYDNYADYFEKSKADNINVTKVEYKDWSIRKSSHSGKIAKSIYSKFNVKQDNTINLHEKGIYVENYELEGKSYQVAVYSAKSTVDLKNDKIRLKGYKELAKHTYVKAGYTKKYGIIVLYDESKKFQLLLQISDGDNPEKVAEQWLNYLAIVVASDEQKEYDKSIWDKIKDKISKLFTKEELPKVWEEDTTDDIILDPNGDWWVTQFDEPLFGNETCWNQECCNKAARRIVSNAGTTVDERIIISQTSRSCEDEKETRIHYDDSGLSFNNDKFDEAVLVIDISLKEHKLPIMVGVQHPYKDKDNNWYYKCGSQSNNPRATNHFIVIVGKGYDKAKKMDFYYFYEVGISNKTKGTSRNNKFWVDTKQHVIKGDVSTQDKKDYYIVTDVRKNLGQTYNIKK